MTECIFVEANYAFFKARVFYEKLAHFTTYIRFLCDRESNFYKLLLKYVKICNHAKSTCSYLYNSEPFSPLLSSCFDKEPDNPTYIFHQSMKYVICFSIPSFFKMYKKEFCFFFMKGAAS